MKGLIAPIAVATAVAGCGGPDGPDEKGRAGPLPDREGGKILDATDLLGSTVDDARLSALRHACSVRVVERNGDMVPMTLDIHPDRISVSVVDGRIDAVEVY